MLLLSTVVDYWCGNAIYKSNHPPRRKAFLILSLVVNLGLLAFFKYSGYFVDLINTYAHTDFKAINFMAVFANNWFGADFDIYEIMLPVGISFYTFQTLSYTIDIYRKEIEPAKNIIDFGFFVTFFPQLVAGPIVRAADFIPQIYKKFSLTREQLGIAIYLILAGLFKKTVVSDYISVNFVDRVFDDPNLYSGFSNLMAVYGFSVQIYCDFSGYSDMAIGLAALLGFQLPLNFTSPYKSVSITDFWRRWHISLSSWLRDYLYISLGGNRKGKVRTYINLMITMLLGGLWHGAATKFIIWGGLHGGALALHKVWMQSKQKGAWVFSGLLGITALILWIWYPLLWFYAVCLFGLAVGISVLAYFSPSIKLSWKLPSVVSNLIAGFVTFHFVAFCWIYFRAESIEKVKLMLNQIATNFDWAGISERWETYKMSFLLIAFGFLIHFLPNQWKSACKEALVSMPDWGKVIVCAIVIFICYQAKTSEIQTFIYFQF